MGLLILALILDALLGDPDWLWRRMPHPVVWFGRLIDAVDKWRESALGQRWLADGGSSGENRQKTVFLGSSLLVLMFGICLSISWFVWFLSSFSALASSAAELVIVSVLVAQKSLYEHVSRVVVAFRADGVTGARKAVSMIVGRDVYALEESDISRASIESLAENYSDGVVAPAFWYLIAGLPGIMFYKAVNTADSMIGHRNERYEYFGKPAALLDDAMNWPAARLSAFLVVFAGLLLNGFGAFKRIVQTIIRDAPTHRSPNAGWPETAFAICLDISLGGPRRYGTQMADVSVLNAAGRWELTTSDIDSALRLYVWTCGVGISLVGLGWFIFR
ncbi:MAG: adenosylcobinamide-phosphate synthase CbiB [Pseudomonadota bacterium]